jgi:PiT family inorganic phosphate transporter
VSAQQLQAIRALSGHSFRHRWELAEALAAQSDAWQLLPGKTVNKLHNRNIRQGLDYLYHHFGAGG